VIGGVLELKVFNLASFVFGDPTILVALLFSGITISCYALQAGVNFTPLNTR
jgi:hypothetical protein